MDGASFLLSLFSILSIGLCDVCVCVCVCVSVRVCVREGVRL